jgi:hypothetical protein
MRHYALVESGHTAAFSPILRILFCSGLGDPVALAASSAGYAGFSSDCLRLPEPPDGRPVCSFPGSEARLLFTLEPGVGDAGLAPLTMPLRVGIWDAGAAAGPSDERMSRDAGGNAFGLGFFCLLLKRKDMACGSESVCRQD